MSPLAHFSGPIRDNLLTSNDYKYNPMVLSFNNKECDKILKLGMPIKNNSSIKATFREDDDDRNIILKEKPKDMSIVQYDREGIINRKTIIHGCDFTELPEYEIDIKFEWFEDFYF